MPCEEKIGVIGLNPSMENEKYISGYEIQGTMIRKITYNDK